MNQELNNILFEINKEGVVGFTNDDDSEKRIRASERLEREGFIKQKDRNTYDLTEKGQKAVDLGGYEKFKEEIEGKEAEKEQLEIDLAKSNIEANRINRKNAKFNRYAIIVNLILGALNVVLLIWQIFSAN